MKLIDKAWEINLTFPKDKKYETKEEIIKYRCPKGDCFNLVKKNDKTLCNRDSEKACLECWNREIDGDDNSRLTFELLEKSPIEGIELCSSNKEDLIEILKDDDILITQYDGSKITYNNLDIFFKWLQDVYDYCTELKNQVNYVDFNFAKMHMINGDKAMFEDETYYIKNGELYCEELNSACALKLRAIESDKWTLL